MAATARKPKVTRAQRSAERLVRQAREKALYEQGWSISQVAREVGVSNYVVHRDLEIAGVPRRAPGYHHYQTEAVECD